MVPLRPLGLGEVFGGAFRYVRANPATTLGTAFVALFVLQVVRVAAQLTLAPPATAASLRDLGGYLLGTLGASGIVGVVGLLVGAASTGVLITVLRGALVGRRTSVGEAWRSVASRLPGLVGLNLLIGIVVVLVMGVGLGLAVALLAVSRASASSVAGAVLLGLVAVVLATYVVVLWAFASTSYVMEDIGVTAALSRSRALVRGAWWRVFGILLVALLIVTVASLVVSIPVSLIGVRSAITGFGATASLGVLVAAAVTALVVGTFAAPFIAGVTGLLYVDQRIRRERFDLELAARAASHLPW